MATLGFNAFTDEARDKLDELGVVWKRIPSPSGGPSGIDIFTESYDLKEKEWRDKPYDHLDFPGDKKEYEAQGFRTWKHPESGDYLMWIGGCVFRKYTIQKVDHRFTPPTIFVTDVLDYREEDDSFRDLLLSIRPMAESGYFQ